jgi:N-acetylglucosamine-6-phosphate deacetylase
MLLGVGAAIVDGRLLNGDVDIRNGVVEAVGIGMGDGSSIAIPGFVDVHVHGYGGVDFSSADSNQHRSAARAITETGVTAYQPTLMTAGVDALVAAVKQHPGTTKSGASVLGFHLEGPFLAKTNIGAHPPDLLLAPGLDLVELLTATDAIAQITLAPELAGVLPVIEALVAAGVVVSMGHSSASAAQTRSAIDAGASAFTHLFNAMGPFSHRDPGILGVALTSRDCYVTVVFDGVHLAPEAERLAVQVSGDRLVAITDGTAAAGARGHGFTLGTSAIDVVDGAPRLGDGTIAGSILTMDRAFRRLVKLGLDLPAATQATSTNPARLAKLEGHRIMPGSRADIAVLNDRLEVIQTLVRGSEEFHS